MSQSYRRHWLKNVHIRFHSDNLIRMVYSCTNLCPNAKRQKYDETTIWFAALTGNLDIIKFLAPLSTDTLNASDMGGNTAIHNAAQEGYLDIIKFLVPLTENPNAPNNIGITPIDLARRKNPWFSESTEGCDDIISILESHK